MDPQTGTIDEGPKGFLGIFKSDTDTDATPPRPDTELSQPEATTPEQAVAAEPAAPERPDGGESAADRVAANLAASLAEDGIELPGEEETTDASGETPLTADGTVDISKLTPEQLQAYVEQAISLQQQLSQREVAEVEREIQAVDTTAQTRKQQLRADVDKAANAWVEQELDARWDEAQDKDDPKGWFMQQRRAIFDTARAHYGAHLQGELAKIDTEVTEYKRQRLKPFYAQFLCDHLPDGTPREQPLPPTAAAELLKVKDPDDMPARAEELLQIANYLGTLDQQHVQKQRAQARQTIVEQAVRTPGTGTAVPLERKPYEGSPQEGLALLSYLHKPRPGKAARSA